MLKALENKLYEMFAGLGRTVEAFWHTVYVLAFPLMCYRIGGICKTRELDTITILLIVTPKFVLSGAYCCTL